MSLVEKLVKLPSSFSVEKEPFLHLYASEGAVSNSVTNRVVGNGGCGVEKKNRCVHAVTGTAVVQPADSHSGIYRLS